jgi:hypothetical protein
VTAVLRARIAPSLLTAGPVGSGGKSELAQSSLMVPPVIGIGSEGLHVRGNSHSALPLQFWRQ